jgi:hypothetical protein
MEKTKILSLIPKDNEIFLTEFLSGTKDMERLMKDFEDLKTISHLPIEKQVEQLKQSYYEKGLVKLPRYKQDLRYPKP